MPLTDAQLETAAEITRESYADVEAKAGDLTTAQEAATLVDLTLWGTIREKHLRVSGGRDGVDLNYERNRSAIRDRVRLRFGFYVEPYPPESTGSGSVPASPVW